ncbi:hypothetical protein EV562_101196 [Streptomyces sp. BK208]|nr:hypothetical protein EV562_101196 [Streptomyces sp. BK208]
MSRPVVLGPAARFPLAPLPRSTRSPGVTA